MKEKSFLKKVLTFFINIFKCLFLFISSLFKRLLKNEKNNVNHQKIIYQKYNSNKNSTKSPSSLPNNPNTNSNNQDNESNCDVILNLTTQELNNLKMKSEKINVFQSEIIDKIIDELLEKEYEKQHLKVENTKDELKENIEKLKEKVIPTIKEKAIKDNITNKETLKDIVQKILREELKEKPLFKETNLKQTPYFIATPKKYSIKFKDSTPTTIKTSSSKVITDKTKKIGTIIKSKPYFMVQNTISIPKPSLKKEIKNIATMSSLIAVNSISNTKTYQDSKLKETSPKSKPSQYKKKESQFSSQKESTITITLPKIKTIEEKNTSLKDQPLKPTTEKESVLLREFQELPDILTSRPKQNNITIKPQDTDNIITFPENELLSQLKKDDNKQKNIQNKEKDEETPKIYSFGGDIAIENVTNKTAEIINDSEQEIRKEEFEDKDYDYYEKQIDRMIDNITNIFLRYEGKLSDKQKKKLKTEEEKLRNTKNNLQKNKELDIETEQMHLDETIKNTELEGLEQELKRLHLENEEEINQKLFSQINNLENMTKEQIANIDKKLLMERLNKTSVILEMSSILALPFIRNKYFLYFTIGMIIDNHFNFINAFFKRKINRYEPADLTAIKKGEDALNNALNINFKNITELDYIVEQTISKYPELQYDQKFIDKVSSIRTKLINNYNKLMRKKQTMEKYRNKTKKQIKILRKKEDYQKAA